eukprot:8745232-Ditylum_brightwellii.AAC.1
MAMPTGVNREATQAKITPPAFTTFIYQKAERAALFKGGFISKIWSQVLSNNTKDKIKHKNNAETDATATTVGENKHVFPLATYANKAQ